jgi:hypothetical protein
MTGVWRALRAEWYRQAGGRAVLLLPLAAALAAAYAWGLGVVADGGALGARSGFYLAAAASSGAALACGAVGALAAASGVGNDLASGLARTVLSRPLPRGAWLAGRLLALAGGVGCVFLSACLGALAAGLARFGLGGAAEGEYVIASPGLLTGQLLTAVGLSLCAQAAAVALGGALGALVRRPGGAVVACGLTGAALAALTQRPLLGRLLPIEAMTVPLDRVAQLAQGIATHHAGDGAPAALAVSALWLAAALALGVVVLRGDVVT